MMAPTLTAPKSISEELLQLIEETLARTGSFRATERELRAAGHQISDRWLRKNFLKKVPLTGQMVVAETGDMPGYYIKSLSQQTGPDGELQKEWTKQVKQPGVEFEIPPGHNVKGISALVDPHGRVIQQWVKTN